LWNQKSASIAFATAIKTLPRIFWCLLIVALYFPERWFERLAWEVARLTQADRGRAVGVASVMIKKWRHRLPVPTACGPLTSTPWRHLRMRYKAVFRRSTFSTHRISDPSAKARVRFGPTVALREWLMLDLWRGHLVEDESERITERGPAHPSIQQNPPRESLLRASPLAAMATKHQVSFAGGRERWAVENGSQH
jgi:hypothetical protein